MTLRASERPGPAPRRATGLFHTAFVYPTRGQLGAALLRVASERAAFSGASDHLVSEALYLDDPDALGIELYRDRPREAWPAPDPGERIKMDTLPLDLDALAAEAEGDASGVRIGHVHLKVADVEAAVAFWTQEVGLELMTGWAGQAAFLAAGGYHHHSGANAWYSLGARASTPSCWAARGAPRSCARPTGCASCSSPERATAVAARGRGARPRRSRGRRARRRRACRRWRCSRGPARWPTPRWRPSRGRRGPRRRRPGRR